jgi:Velvet factor/Fungal Zn(2)-Cys(6) binuclear cluster domain
VGPFASKMSRLSCPTSLPPLAHPFENQQMTVLPEGLNYTKFELMLREGSFLTRTTVNNRVLTYILNVIQQPQQARACGPSEKSPSDGRPIDPPPILSLLIFELRNGIQTDITFSYDASFFVFASLETAGVAGHGRFYAERNSPISVLTGHPVSGGCYLEHPHRAIFFLFPDLSVGNEGKYRLCFNLFETTKNIEDRDPTGDESASGSEPVINTVINNEVTHWRLDIRSTRFAVFTRKKFPGLTNSTSLTRLFADQGCRLRTRSWPRMMRRAYSSKEPEAYGSIHPIDLEASLLTVQNDDFLASSAILSSERAEPLHDPTTYASRGELARPMQAPNQDLTLHTAPPPSPQIMSQSMAVTNQEESLLEDLGQKRRRIKVEEIEEHTTGEPPAGIPERIISHDSVISSVSTIRGDTDTHELLLERPGPTAENEGITTTTSVSADNLGRHSLIKKSPPVTDWEVLSLPSSGYGWNTITHFPDFESYQHAHYAAIQGGAIQPPDMHNQDGQANLVNEGGNSVERAGRIACFTCKKSKLKCDGSKPSCSTCTKVGRNCVYSEARRTSGPNRDYVEDLDEELMQSPPTRVWATANPFPFFGHLENMNETQHHTVSSVTTTNLTSRGLSAGQRSASKYSDDSMVAGHFNGIDHSPGIVEAGGAPLSNSEPPLTPKKQAILNKEPLRIDTVDTILETATTKNPKFSYNLVEKQYRNALNSQSSTLLGARRLDIEFDEIEGNERDDSGRYERKVSKAEVMVLARRHIENMEKEKPGFGNVDKPGFIRRSSHETHNTTDTIVSHRAESHTAHARFDPGLSKTNRHASGGTQPMETLPKSKEAIWLAIFRCWGSAASTSLLEQSINETEITPVNGEPRSHTIRRYAQEWWHTHTFEPWENILPALDMTIHVDRHLLQLIFSSWHQDWRASSSNMRSSEDWIFPLDTTLGQEERLVDQLVCDILLQLGRAAAGSARTTHSGCSHSKANSGPRPTPQKKSSEVSNVTRKRKDRQETEPSDDELDGDEPNRNGRTKRMKKTTDEFNRYVICPNCFFGAWSSVDRLKQDHLINVHNFNTSQLKIDRGGTEAEKWWRLFDKLNPGFRVANPDAFIPGPFWENRVAHNTYNKIFSEAMTRAEQIRERRTQSLASAIQDLLNRERDVERQEVRQVVLDILHSGTRNATSSESPVSAETMEPESDNLLYSGDRTSTVVMQESATQITNSSTLSNRPLPAESPVNDLAISSRESLPQEIISDVPNPATSGTSWELTPNDLDMDIQSVHSILMPQIPGTLGVRFGADLAVTVTSSSETMSRTCSAANGLDIEQPFGKVCRCRFHSGECDRGVRDGHEWCACCSGWFPWSAFADGFLK